MKPSLPPEIKTIQRINLPKVESSQLSNGLPVHFVLMGTQEVVKIEFVFWAGRSYEQEKLVARTSATLIKEGTDSLSSATVAEFFDYHGASISIPVQTDTANFSVYCLSRQIPQVLPLLIKLLINPAFREKDLRAHILREQHRLKEDLSKNEVIAYRHITECFYGESHPYGYNSFPNSYANLTPSALHAHHKRCYNANNGFAIISGQVDSPTKAFIYKQLEQIPTGELQKPLNFNVITQTPQTTLLKGQGRMQSTIRMGRRLFARNHADANGIYMLSTILGGYFGSRLMTNIRENKGYTYQIYAGYESLRYDGALQIDTEVSPELVNPCLKEIYLEIERLQNDLVPDGELKMVRNYLMGSFLSMVDGPFNWSETLKTLWTEQLDATAFQSLIASVQGMNSHEIRDLAQSYLKKEDLWTIVVGE